MAKYTVEVDGVTYTTLKDIAIAYGIDYEKFKTAVSRKKESTLEDVVADFLSVEGMDKRYRLFNVFGREYRGYDALATEYGINPRTISTAVFRGASVEDAILRAMNTQITYNGLEYANLAVLVTSLGLSYHRVYRRLRMGWTLRDSLEVPLRPQKSKTGFTVRGIRFESLLDAFSHFGYDYTFISSNAKAYGFTDRVDAFEWTDAFFSRYRGDRPDIISSIPYVIYNGIWVRTKDEFMGMCNLTGKNSRLQGMTALKLARYFADARTILFDLDGEWLTHADYKKARNVVSISPKVPTKKVPRYPECTFNPSGYCADISADWAEYRAQRLALLEADHG